MKTVLVRDDFRCAVLEDGDLEIFFQAKRASYSDVNDDIAHNRDEVLQAMDETGPAYFDEIFKRDGGTAFVLLDSESNIIGSAEALHDPQRGTMELQAGHVRSDLRGR